MRCREVIPEVRRSLPCAPAALVPLNHAAGRGFWMSTRSLGFPVEGVEPSRLVLAGWYTRATKESGVDLIMEWLPLAALIGGLIVCIVGSVVALPAIFFPPLELIALPMAFGGLAVAIWGGYTIHSQRQLEGAQTRYLEEYREYAKRWDACREALGRTEQDAVELGLQRIRAVYALLDSQSGEMLSATQADSIQQAYGKVERAITAHRIAVGAGSGGPPQEPGNAGPAGRLVGITTGAAMVTGLYGVTATFGTAGTGTAISALSGAAAQSATTAVLGGGTLVAGGLGVAGGGAVLGGLVAIPALIAQIGLQEFQKREFLDQLNQHILELRSGASELEDVTGRIDELGLRVREMTGSLAKATARVANPSGSQDPNQLARRLIDLLERPITAE